MTGEGGWVHLRLACTPRCGMDRMQRDEAETSTDPSPSGAFCFLTLILMNKVVRGPGQPLGQDPGAPADGPTQPAPRCAAASPGPVGSAGVGAGVWVEEEAWHLCSQGRRSRAVKNTHYLFLVLLTAGRISEMGPEEPALQWLPRVQRAQALCPERWPGGPAEGRTPCPPCHHCHSRTSCSVSESGGPGLERALVWRLLSCPTPH